MNTQQTHQEHISIGVLFWPALVATYSVLIFGLIWLIWG